MSENEEVVEAGRLGLMVAAAKIDRDVRLSELTVEEERALVAAILEAATGELTPVFKHPDATAEFAPEKD